MIIEILLVFLILIFISFGFGILKFYKIIKNFLPAGVLHSTAPTQGDSKLTVTWKYKFILLKAYFDNGYSLTSYPKWAFAIMGIGSSIKGHSLWWLVFGALFYGVGCFITGYFYLKMGFYEAQQEVNNQFNPFVKEVRERKTI